MNGRVDISLIVALCSGVRLALKHIQRLLIVIGIVTLSVITFGALLALLMLLAIRVSTSYALLVTVHALLFVGANVVIHGFILWYFEEVLRIVRGHTRSFARIKQSLVRGWHLFGAQVLFAGIVGGLVIVCTYPALWFAQYFSLSMELAVLLILLLYMPGLYVAARLCLYPFFIADDKSAFGSLRSSFIATHNHVFALMPMGIVRLIALLGVFIPSFMLLTIPTLLKVGLMLMAGLYLVAIFDLATAHMYQRLTHPDQAAVPPGVHPLD